MTDTIEALKAAAADLTARVAAFERARVKEEEPPAPTEEQYLAAYTAYGDLPQLFAARLRYCERELARLREGLEVQVGDVGEDRLALWVTDEDSLWIGDMAREIQRHRALLKDGGGK